ncbi:hypothetical protein TSAR_002891 [Trichomalopsis sarcophagae]|uniref:Uncharacterized protein n=1 Tax=Trichomalopsis sarcophagae TaxID=543379 RepID=A0A232EG47_9HYME|nr:hypothetical protein TSAR_002891 [Trichomalopsis sarcophagae]
MKFRIGRLSEYELDEELEAKGFGLRGSTEVRRNRLLRAYISEINPILDGVPWYEWDIEGERVAISNEEMEWRILGEIPPTREKKRRVNDDNQVRLINPRSSESEYGGDDHRVGVNLNVPQSTAVATTTASSVITSRAGAALVTATAALSGRPITSAVIGNLISPPTPAPCSYRFENRMLVRHPGAWYFSARIVRGELRANGMTYEQAREKSLEKELELEGQRVFNQAMEEFDMKVEEEEVRRRHQRNLQQVSEEALNEVRQVIRLQISLRREEELRPEHGQHRSVRDGERKKEDLMEDLRRRTQHKDEKITTFLAKFEYIVSRFHQPPSKRELLQIAYRNILLEYWKAIGDKLIDSLEDLEKYAEKMHVSVAADTGEVTKLKVAAVETVEKDKESEETPKKGKKTKAKKATTSASASESEKQESKH